MRKALVVALAVAAALSFTTVARAAAPVPIQWWDEFTKLLRTVSETYPVPTREMAPSAQAYDFRPMVISTIFQAATDTYNGGAFTNRDSTIVFDNRGFNRAALYFWPAHTADSDVGGSMVDSLGLAVFALQVREHATANSDTNNTLTAPVHRFAPNPPGSTVGAYDTIGSAYDLNRWNSGWQRRQCLPGERPIVVSNFGQKANRAILIWTSDRHGSTAAGNDLPPFTSFRMRFLEGYRAVAGAGAGALIDTVWVGATQGYARMRGRLDYVRWYE